MKKFLGITFGGLQRKALVLVLLVLALTSAMFTGVTLYQNRQLVRIVDDTRTEQQQAISSIASRTMHQVVDGSLTETTSLQAQLADNDFSEVIRNVYMLQTMAQGLLENRSALAPLPLRLPEASMDGESAAYVLCEQGVDYTQSQWLGLIAHLSTPMIAMHHNSEKIDSCYIGLADGTDLCVDEKAGLKLDASGQPLPFPVRDRPWYTGAIEEGGLYYSDLIPDAFSGQLLVTCSLPILVDGQIIGVVGLDIVLDNMYDFISPTSEGISSYVMNSHGRVILGPKKGLFSQELAAQTDLRAGYGDELTELLALAQKENTGLHTLTLDGKEYYMVGAPMPSVGWTILNVVDKQLTEQSERMLLEQYVFRRHCKSLGGKLPCAFVEPSAISGLIGAVFLKGPVRERFRYNHISERVFKVFARRERFFLPYRFSGFCDFFKCINLHSRQMITLVTST